MEPRTAPAKRIMVVDDSPLIVRMIADFFAPHGYEILAAGDGAEALDLIAAGTVPDAIVADVLMPRVDGWTLFEQVRRRPDTAEVPFVFLTVEKDLPKRLRGLHLGADDYLTKPFDVEELHARVERILEKRAALESARQGGDALLAGTVEHMAMSDLLQILALNHKDGVVSLREGEREGRIVFEGGEMVHAACGGVKGKKALYRMLGWSAASFRVLPRAERVTERSIEAPATSVLMDGLVSLDEWIRWRDLIPDQDTELRLAADAKIRLADHAVTVAEFEVMARARTGTTVGTILEESHLPDADLAEAMCTLLTRGVLLRSP